MSIHMTKKEIRRQLDEDIAWLRSDTKGTDGLAKVRIIEILEDWFDHLDNLDEITGEAADVSKG
jgi:hypothetical protein